jgi:hypothetical protein
MSILSNGYKEFLQKYYKEYKFEVKNILYVAIEKNDTRVMEWFIENKGEEYDYKGVIEKIGVLNNEDEKEILDYFYDNKERIKFNSYDTKEMITLEMIEWLMEKDLIKGKEEKDNVDFVYIDDVDAFMILIEDYIEESNWMRSEKGKEKRLRIKEVMKKIVKTKNNSKEYIKECIKKDHSGILELVVEEEENKNQEEFIENYVVDTIYTKELIELCDEYEADNCYEYMYSKLEWEDYYENKSDTDNESENE